MEKIQELSAQDQAIYFLNAFWTETNDKAETIYSQYNGFIEVAKMERTAEGKEAKESDIKDVNEVFARKFLERDGKTLTAIAFRGAFREIDVNNDGRMSFIEFLLYDNKQTVEELLKREQATTPEFEAAKEAYAAVMAAIAGLEKQKADLQAEAEGTGVKANAAKAQLAQLLAADNLELNRLVTNAEEGLKKAKKTVGAAPGGVWWFNRQLEEAKKYKPGKKAGSSTTSASASTAVSTPKKPTPVSTKTETKTEPSDSAKAAAAASSLRREREAAFQHLHAQFVEAKDPKSLLALLDDRIIRQKLQDLATPIQTDKPKPAAVATAAPTTPTKSDTPASPKSPVSPKSPTQAAKCLGGCGFRGRDKLEGYCDLCYRKKIGLS
jgi:stage V sporulation protein SpoVS